MERDPERKSRADKMSRYIQRAKYLLAGMGITVLVVGLAPILFYCCLLGLTILVSDEVGLMSEPWLPWGCPPDCAGVDLRDAKPMSADFSGANLADANLSNAYLMRIDLSEANLRKAGLFSADLTEANLSGADLRDADLSFADLTAANLSGADLRGAKLDGARLARAILIGAIVTDEQLNEAYSLNNAIMPDGTVYCE